MTVFKNYFKIVNRHKGMILLFMGLVVGLAILNTMSGNPSQDFTKTKPNIAIIKNDSSELIDNFEKYIGENANVVKVENTSKAIQDALYKRDVTIVLTFPSNYTNDFLNGKEPKIEIKKTMDASATYTELLINRYFKISDIYSKSNMNEKDIINSIGTDLKKESNIEIMEGSKTAELQNVVTFYGFQNYAILSISIYIIGTIMCIFNKDNVKKRNLISSVPYKKISSQLLLGHLVFGLAIWLIFVIISIILYKGIMFTTNGILIMLNSLVFTFTSISMAYLVGKFIKKEEVLSAIQNVIPLGLSFISGCFVPAQWIVESVLNVAKFFPSYYFIKNNYDIAKLSEFNLEVLQPIIINGAIVFGFAIIYLIIARIFNKRKIA